MTTYGKKYHTTDTTRPLAGEVLRTETPPIRTAISDPLPTDALRTGLNGASFSIRGAMQRARTRAELSREAYALYKTAVVESMRQQIDVLIQGRELTASAQKRAQFEAFLATNTELVDRLWARLETAVNSMKDSELEAILSAEEEAQRRKAEIERRVADGHLDEAAAERVLGVVDEHRLFKASAAFERCTEFLEELKSQFLMTIRTMEVDGKKYL